MTLSKLQELPFYFGNAYKLFGVLHYPDIPKRDCGLILCSPFFEEKLWSHRVFVNFARNMARKGFAILRFDYMGQGDSEGDCEDSTIDSCLSDIDKSVEILRARTGVSHVGLLGLRLGATLAGVSAESIPGIDFLVLWEPVVKVEEYLQQCLRSNLTTQMATYKRIIRTRKQITDELLNGSVANIDGYLISGEFYKQASKIHLSNHDIRFSNPVQIIQISRRENLPINGDLRMLHETKYREKNQRSELSMVVEEPFWAEIKTYYHDAPSLFRTTISWIETIMAQNHIESISARSMVS